MSARRQPISCARVSWLRAAPTVVETAALRCLITDLVLELCRTRS
ncbi:hypothetical protein ACFV0O_00085 [Kitasatospora sp. NPDC059577]